MTGPEHYIQSEAYAREAEAQLGDDNLEAARIYAELATGSATRALAAATAMSGRDSGMHRFDFEAWDNAAGVAEPPSGGDD